MSRTGDSTSLVDPRDNGPQVLLRPPHDPAFYISALLCCSSPYIPTSPRSLVGISQLCDTSPLPPSWLIYSRFITLRQFAFCIGDPTYFFICSPTIPHAPFPSIRQWFLLFLNSFAMITLAYCVPFYVYALPSSTL